jgi:hypothetical protein
VRRLPCDPARFWNQRVRQAYDDLAEPARLVAVLSLLPATAVAASRMCGTTRAGGRCP